MNNSDKTILHDKNKGSESKTAIMNYKGTFEEKRMQQMHDRSMCYPKFAQAFFEANQ